ncbi:hypothetical protein [Sphingobium sp.]|uniref:hypothetical protein n=1 Tax=Sphingobium sp. TaxID=1912891 RepID=UPI0028BD6919|nr:hypothetical protein [Sphingobium sp.]
MDDADVASPFPLLSASGPAGKKCFAKGTNNRRICFTAVRFFQKSLEFCVLISRALN